LAAAVLVLFVVATLVSWTSSPLFHSLVEVTATLLAGIVGMLALVRYYSHKNVTLLLVGAGFLGTAFLDAAHLVVTAQGFPWRLATESETLGHWSWFAPQMFLSLVLVWSWWEWRREVRVGPERARIPELRVYLEVGALALVSLALLGFVALPPAIHPGAQIPRPAELIPGALFGVTLAGYLVKGNWRSRPFEVWLVAALLLAFASQTLFMSLSSESLDAFSTGGHLLRVASYALILIGLVSSMFGLYRQVERSTYVIRHANEALRGEIEERKIAEDAARESEEKYRTILETIQEWYYEVDLAGNFTFANDSLARLLGYEVGELERMNYRRYTEDPYSRAVFETFNHVYRTGEVVESFGWEILCKDGGRRYAEASAGAIEDAAGEIVGFRGIVRDVTPRRRAEEKLKQRSHELARTNEELRQFASVASHDLQEPLRMVAGYTQLLARRYQGQLDEEADQFIGYAVDGVTRMQNLIEDLLSYSRIQTHGRAFEPVSALESLDWALTNLKCGIEEADAIVTQDELPVVQADPSQLGQLFQNLIANSMKFRGECRLRIHIGAQRGTGEWVFSVRDNGIGLDPQYGSRIFEIFQRLHPQDEYEGTGIGLAICKRIVERHAGRIWVESMPGHGATVYFTFADAPGAMSSSGSDLAGEEIDLEVVGPDLAEAETEPTGARDAQEHDVEAEAVASERSVEP
jgi:PAS domain S-box-containing protein